MNEFKIRIYYRFIPSATDPHEEEKNKEEIQEALLSFENKISNYIDSDSTIVSSLPTEDDDQSKIVSIKSMAGLAEIKESTKSCLKNLNLLAERL